MLMAILMTAVAGAQDKVQSTVKTMPPPIIKTYAQARDIEVDPSLKEITKNHSSVPYLLVSQTTRKADPSPDRDGEAAAISVADAWLSLVDKGDYKKSWFEAAQYFKNAISEDQWEQAIRAARKPLGKNLSRELISKSYHTSLPGAPDGEYFVIRFKSSFENKKSATETITPMLDKDGKWRVSGYYVR